jgi:hypothetical protein
MVFGVGFGERDFMKDLRGMFKNLLNVRMK